MSATSGPMYEMPFAQYDLDTQSWKTSEVTSLWVLPMSSPTLPAWGGMRNGELFEHRTPERPTVAPDCSSSSEMATLRTPNAGLGERGRDGLIHKKNPRQQLDLNNQLATLLLPAPKLAIDLLPTPTVMDMGSNYTPEEWSAWKAKQKAAHNNGNGHGASLTQEALTLLPTPTAQEPGYTGLLVDGDGNPVEHTAQRCYDPKTGRLVQTGLHQTVARIGVSTRQRSTDGNPLLDELHQPQLFDEESATDSTPSLLSG